MKLFFKNYYGLIDFVCKLRNIFLRIFYVIFSKISLEKVVITCLGMKDLNRSQ